MRNTTASSTVTPQRAGREHQVYSSFINTSSSSSTSSTPMSSTLPRSPLDVTLLVVEVVLRLQLKAQGGVDGDDAAAGGKTVSDVGGITAVFHAPASGRELTYTCLRTATVWQTTSFTSRRLWWSLQTGDLYSLSLVYRATVAPCQPEGADCKKC